MMPPIIEGPPESEHDKRPLRSRLLWFVLLWIAAAAATATAAYILRALIIR